MKKVLVMLILGILFLGWNFVIPTGKKVDLPDLGKLLQGLSGSQVQVSGASVLAKT